MNRTFRRRQTKVFSHYGYDGGEGYDTQLEVYPEHIRITQVRGDLLEIMVLDSPTTDYLIRLWGEVKPGGDAISH